MATTPRAPQKVIVKGDVQKKGTFPQRVGPIVIKYPMIWLALIVLAVYFPTFSFGFTELDDSIFIKEFHEYNEDLANLVTSFHRGLFDAVKDPYYRPLFLDSMILNYKMSGAQIMGYHVVNVLLHMASVVLLYQVFIRIKLNQFHAFLLAVLFAVHPVLSQAVSWIPGRNDTLLAIFTCSFFIFALDYAEYGKIKALLLSVLFLLLAFFTKETAVFIAPVAFVLLVFVLQKGWLSKSNLVLYATWVGCFVIWYAMRAQASNIRAATQPNMGTMADDFLHRLPLIIQYIGKVFIPVNLSVFPMQEDTTYIYGIVAALVLVATLYFSKNVNWHVVIGGLVIFLLFLIPALLVPNNLNQQTFEHRLYLPMIGVLLIISETVLFKKLTDDNLLLYSGIVAVLLAIGNYGHQRNFTDPHTFWSNAVATSPHSAYANMMLGAREDDLERSYTLFRTAYKLNPKERYLNYYYGKMLQMKDSVLASEPYLLAEKNTSGYYECDFYLARVAIMKNDTAGAINYLKNYLKTDVASAPANNNLLLMLISMGRIEEANAHMAHMRQIGLPIPAELKQPMPATQPALPRN